MTAGALICIPQTTPSLSQPLAQGTYFDHPVGIYDNGMTSATLLISWKDGRRKIANTEMTLSLTVIDTVD